MSITYRELFNMIPEERMDDDVTLYLQEMDEYFAVNAAKVHGEEGVLDAGHVYLKM